MSGPWHVGFDARYINDRYHGIGRYAFRLLEALVMHGADNASGRATDHTWAVFRGPATNSRFDWDQLAARDNVELLEGPWPLYWPQEQLHWPARLRRAGVDIFYTPHFVAPVGASCPVVITVHDLIFDHYPAYMPRPWSRPYYRLLMALSTRRARRIVTLSEATAGDLHETYGVSRRKIAVVPPAADPRLSQAVDVAEQRSVRQKFGLARPFVLSVGARRPHKNLARLVRAYAKVAAQVNHDLVFAGPADDRLPDEARLEAQTLGLLDRIHFLGWLPESDLRALYGLADVVAVVSLVEGFGLPALEALSCGTPVLAADASSLPEVVGNAGVLVNPHDEDAIARALLELLHDADWRRRLSLAGRARATEFSWQKTAHGLLQALQEAYR